VVTHPQLTLALGMPAMSSLDSFHCESANAELVATLSAFCSGELDEQQILLWGDRDVGKTHLLSATCQLYSGNGYQVGYMTGDIASRDEALDGLENLDLVCLDDLHLLSVDAEESVYGLINRCRDHNTRLLMASLLPVDELPLALPDLRTRLTWGPVFHVQALTDDALPVVMQQLFEERSLQVSDDVIEFVLRRYPRDIAAIKSLVQKLDEVSLSTQRRITIPLVKSTNETMA